MTRHREMGSVHVSPVYEVTANWIERYYSSLRIEAADEAAAVERAREVWRLRAEWFLGNSKFEDSELVGFEVDQSDPGRVADVSAADSLAEDDSGLGATPSSGRPEPRPS